MNKILHSKYGIGILVVLLAGISYLAALFHFRLDLTAEKRYTLSEPTKQLLRKLDTKVTVRVFLDGDLPAGFKKLRNSTRELLDEFKEYGGQNLQIVFQKIGDGLDGEEKERFLDSMARLGIKPYTVEVQSKKDESSEERMVVPGALIEGGTYPVAINLLSGQGSASLDESVINSTEALLEYKFIQAIQKVTQPEVPLIGYLLGNGETFSPNVKSFVEDVLMRNYNVRFLPIDTVSVIPPQFNALVIMKPSIPFTNPQKLKIDQYIMNGGKVLWLVDRLYAEMDSLMRKQSDFVAFDRNLNLDDILFKYGVRINADLVQDLQSDKFPLVVGSVGDQPQMELVDWPYFPLLNPSSSSPITKNLNKVLSLFPNSIDTIKTTGIRKTFLLTSSENARSLITPAIVSLNSVKTEDDLKTFSKSSIPIAVLLEGKFPSLYSNRLSGATLDSLASYYKTPFRNQSEETKMIVVSDADIATNVVTQNEGPLEVGLNQFTKAQYANKDFLLNSLEYLVNPSGILETRSKDFTLRLLDPKKLEANRSLWQALNLLLPVSLILLFGFLFQYLRKRAYRA